MNRFCTILVVLLMCCVDVVAQSLHTTSAASDYDRGLSMYQDGNYNGCIDVMSALLRRSDAAQYYEEAAFYVAMSQSHRSMDSTPYQLNAYLDEYPYSLHRDEVFLALADYYFNIGEYEQAIEHYTRLDIDNIKYSEQDDFNFHLAYSYLNMEQLDKALPLFSTLSQNSADYRYEARYFEGYIYYRKGNYKEAHRSLSQVNAASEYGMDAQYLLACIELQEENYAQVIAIVKQLMEQEVSQRYEVELYRMNGVSHYQLGNDAQAYESLNNYMAKAETPHRTASYMCGILAYRNGQYERSVALLEGVCDTTDALAQNALLHQGLAHLQLKENNNAITAFDRAAGMNYDDAVREVAMYNLALCVYESEFDLFDNALKRFEAFVAEYPRSEYIDDVNTRISYLYIHSRNYAKALDYIDRIKQPSGDILKQRQQILYLIGTECFANNRISDAAQYFSQAIKAGNHALEYKARSIYWLGECCYRRNAYREALKCYNQFLSTQVTTDDMTVALAHYNTAYCYFEMQDYSKAREEFERFTGMSGASRKLYTDAYNRLGDCYFQDKQYAQAEKQYNRAAGYKGSGSDYALLQEAVVCGVRKNNSRKITLLNTLIADYPRSEYNEEAYSELGHTYMAMNKPAKATEIFNRLLQQYPQGSYTRNAMLQLGALYYNSAKIDASIATYKELITQHPNSSEAKIAIDDLKSIYIEINQVDELSSFMQKQGIQYQRNELDSLSYIAAERSYMNKGDITPLESYVANYPQGNYAAQAYFYMGNMADAAADDDKALDCYTRSLAANDDSDFAEDATIRCCEIFYEKAAYEQAVEYYTRLEKIATAPDTRQWARMGAIRCYHHAGNSDKVIAVAERLTAGSNLSPEVEQEVLYYRAQAHLDKGEQARAHEDFVTLSQDTRSQYGAEAAYRVAQYQYDNKNYAEAESAANAFVQKGTSHAYWLARNFILLSDIYRAQGDVYTAQQYLKQLQNNYPGGDDDIASLIDTRLQQLQ